MSTALRRTFAIAAIVGLLAWYAWYQFEHPERFFPDRATPEASPPADEPPAEAPRAVAWVEGRVLLADGGLPVPGGRVVFTVVRSDAAQLAGRSVEEFSAEEAERLAVEQDVEISSRGRSRLALPAGSSLRGARVVPLPAEAGQPPAFEAARIDLEPLVVEDVTVHSVDLEVPPPREER